MSIKSGDEMSAPTLDMLYLEWSRITRARTARELALSNSLRAAIGLIDGAPLPKMIDPEFYRQSVISTARHLLEDGETGSANVGRGQ